jgi:hypothetical protein
VRHDHLPARAENAGDLVSKRAWVCQTLEQIVGICEVHRTIIEREPAVERGVLEGDAGIHRDGCSGSKRLARNIDADEATGLWVSVRQDVEVLTAAAAEVHDGAA